MSLFKQLEKLYRPDRFQREDFHTEIVAQVLRNSHELTLVWLASLNITESRMADHVGITVATQETFEKLPGHLVDSRPDITIRIVADGKKELILIESKVDAKQGSTQLERYAAILASEKISKTLDRTSLVFITRDYEAAAIALNATDRSFSFKVTRWFEFYDKLKAHVNGDGLANQLKLFMEENRMSLGNQFRSTDLVAMENFLSAKALMDETLAGEVSEKAKTILGSVSNLTRNVEEQLRDFQRYVVYSGECVIGYWFPHENPDKPVWVGIELWSDPKSKTNKEEIQAYRGWIEKSAGSWTSKQLDNGWSCMRRGKPIQLFMGQDDHVQAIKNHFLQLLDEIGQFKKADPNLPCGAGTTESEE